jgi:chemotaxis family two-component system response regulator Rcp1
MFRILIVDDDRAAAHLLRTVLKRLQRPHEEHLARDGVEALAFLRACGTEGQPDRPNLVLLDMNMPNLDGLETLSAIKSDPDLCVIPVIMFSSVSTPHQVRRCYEAHANCYVLKPTDLERSVNFVRAIEAFWIDFAHLPSRDQVLPASGSGTEVASGSTEATSQATRRDDSPGKEIATSAQGRGCEEHQRLFNGFGEAVGELVKLHQQQFLAIVEGDTDSHRFDLLIHMANESKQRAKYAYLSHVEAHGCSSKNAINEAGTRSDHR